MKKVLTIAACAGLLFECIKSLIHAIPANNSVDIALCMIFSLLSLTTLVVTLFEELRGHIRIKNTKKINKKITEFINTRGETVIVSKDLSWVTTKTIDKLREKVEVNGDRLKIFLPSENDTSKTIAEFADVRYFGNIVESDPLENLVSRFTIINYGNDSVRITYPHRDANWHINTEYTKGDSVLTLATDLVSLLDLLTKAQRK